MKKLMMIVVLALISMAGAAQNFRANLDESVKPGDDFWQYAKGEKGFSVVMNSCYF